ncbi:MAG: pyridoxal phosphate-dependent aminotransferase [Ectothiorhodospiraceae bacterium]|nr:pyridoxal phosphate-dependent aminotransferase [Ectothiorhodospiraceae bacterium]
MDKALSRLKPRIANRMSDIVPFHVMDVLAKARALEAAGRDIVHMEIGEPDFATPAPVREAAKRATDEGKTHYTPAVGLPALREAISAYYQSDYGVSVAPERIIVTPGASGALLLAMGVLVNPGDQVLMADPGYPCNRHFVRLMEGEAVGIPVGADTAYQLTAEQLVGHWTDKTVATLLATPSNPTGTLVSPSSMHSMLDVVTSHGGRLIVDEIYHGLTYGCQAETALSLSDELFVINSFSKYFSMTGWRLGWLVAPETYVRDVDKLAQNVFLAAPTLSQYAALAAFSPESREIMHGYRDAFEQRRNFLLPALRELGFDISVEPTGAFYLYADCSRFTDDSYTFALDVLEKAGVAITPGKDFGAHQPEHYVRFAYTTSLARLEEGVERLARYLKG